MTLAIDPLVSMVDTAFVSALGTAHLAALGINSAIFFIAFFISNFLAYGTTPLVSEAVGEEDVEEARRLSSEAIIVALVLGAVVFFVLVLGRNVWLQFMGTAAGHVFTEAERYLTIRALAAPAVFLITAGNGIFRGYGDTRNPLYITIFLNLINLALDALLIVGLGFGLAGAAVATVVAQWCGALCFLAMLQRNERLVRVQNPRFGLFLSLGGMLGLRTLSLVGTIAVATSAATRIGVATVAAHQVVLQVWLTWALVIDSIAVAAQIMVPRAIAAKDATRLHELLRRLWAWGGLIGFCLAGATFALIPTLPEWFSSEPDVISAIRASMYVLIPLQPLGGIVFVGDGVFLGAKRFGFLALTCCAGGLMACFALIFFCKSLVGIWFVLLGFVLFRAVAMGFELIRTRGRLVSEAQG